DRLDPVEERRGLRRRAVADIGPGERKDEQHGGQDEQAPGQDQAEAPGAGIAQIDRKLGRRWPRDQGARAQEVEERLLAEPLAPDHDLLPHQRDMGRGPAERDAAELEKEERDLAGRSATIANAMRHVDTNNPALS